MAKKTTQRKPKPASNPDSREKQMIRLAVDLAEQQLRDGTAPASVINHYLKLGTKKEELERQILERQAELIKSKAETITHDREAHKVAQEAIEAMRSYGSSNG